MSVELWKSIFDWATVVLIAFTVVSGAGALITGDIISKRQEAKLRKFDVDLTGAKTELGNVRHAISAPPYAGALQGAFFSVGIPLEGTERPQDNVEILVGNKPN